MDSDRSVIPATAVPLEILALEAAVERVLAEGLTSVQRRHRCSAAATRAGRGRSGSRRTSPDAEAAVVATTVVAPSGTDARLLVERARADRPVALSAGFATLAATVLRIDHTGQRARLEVVLSALEALGGVLNSPSAAKGLVRDALEVAERAWSAEEARSAC